MTLASVWALMLGMDGQVTMGYDPAGRRDRLTIGGPSRTRRIVAQLAELAAA